MTRRAWLEASDLSLLLMFLGYDTKDADDEVFLINHSCLVAIEAIQARGIYAVHLFFLMHSQKRHSLGLQVLLTIHELMLTSGNFTII
jgi:hypothetical protein